MTVNMSQTPDSPTPVGQQLKERREALDLTQGALAALIRVTVTSISAAENGRATISRGRRASWESALQLKAGTITRAYKDGTPLEVLSEVPPDEPPYADLSDPKEAAIWKMHLPEEDRRELIDMSRMIAERKRRQRPV